MGVAVTLVAPHLSLMGSHINVISSEQCAAIVKPYMGQQVAGIAFIVNRTSIQQSQITHNGHQIAYKQGGNMEWVLRFQFWSFFCFCSCCDLYNIVFDTPCYQTDILVYRL